MSYKPCILVKGDKVKCIRTSGSGVLRELSATNNVFTVDRQFTENGEAMLKVQEIHGGFYRSRFVKISV